MGLGLGWSLTTLTLTLTRYNPQIGNFDNTVNGMILLFEIITSEMWPDMLHLMQDASEPNEAPSTGASLWAARIFCVAWITTGGHRVA